MSKIPNILDYKTKFTNVNEEEVKSFVSNSQFNDLGIGLFKEISVLIIPTSSILRLDDNKKVVPFSHEESALIGNLVRYCKLSTAFIEQVAKGRLETSLIFFRTLAETYITIKYFLKYKDENTLKHYIKHSLKLEKEILDIIKNRVKDELLVNKIEQRIIDSIKNSFRLSDFDEEDVSKSSKWSSKVKGRIDEILAPEAYVLMYGIASHAIHGNWQDIITFHLKEQEEGFLPDAEWTYPTLQILSGATYLSCDLLKNYATVVIPESQTKKELIEYVDEILDRAIRLDMYHEKFRQQN